MKKLFILLFLLISTFSFSQEMGMYFILDGNDDVTEIRSQAPQFTQMYLKLGRTPDLEQIRIGLRFQNVTIPAGSIIQTAFIQFTSCADSPDDSVTMMIYGEKSANAAPFENEPSEIFLRPVTDTHLFWDTQNWQDFTPGTQQKTPELKEIIQEIINIPGWASGNAMHIKMYKYSFGQDSLRGCASEYMGEMYAPYLRVDYIDPSNVYENVDFPKLALYPNPADEQFTLQFEQLDRELCTIELFDLQGKKVRVICNQVLTPGLQEFHISMADYFLKPGTYYLSIRGGAKTLSKTILIR